MPVPHRHAATLVDVVALALMASGPAMIVRGRAGKAEVRAELVRQKIEFPAEVSKLPPRLSSFTARPVHSGADARAYSELIKDHLENATGGRSYAEITAELGDSDEKDEKLVALRHTAFMGESLRSGLLGAYQAEEITHLVTALGVLFTGIGAGLLALTHGKTAGNA